MNKEFIISNNQICYNGESISFEINESINITKIDAIVYLEKLINKLLLLAYWQNKAIINQTNTDLSSYHFKNQKITGRNCCLLQ